MVTVLLVVLIAVVVALVSCLWLVSNKQKKVNVVSRKKLQEERDFYKNEWIAQLNAKQAYMDRMKDKANKWEGKFVIVKNENNKLRKQILVSEKAIDDLSDRLATVINQAKEDQQIHAEEVEKLKKEISAWNNRMSEIANGPHAEAVL